MNAQPHPGIPVGPPHAPPLPGQVIVSYQIVEPETGCCKCNDLNTTGIVVLIIGILLFWPIAIIPCCSPSMKTKKQVPVYGYPGGAPVAVVPMQQPVGYVATPMQPAMQPAQQQAYPAVNPVAEPMPVADNREAPAAIPEAVKPDNTV